MTGHERSPLGTTPGRLSPSGGTGYPHDPDLRARLQSFALDEPGAVFPFTARLAAEKRWTRAFARRVAAEYLRFVYLAATAGHPVTPSAAVDAAWHLHLTYTRSYWDGLCAQVLPGPLHHEPTRGGAAETAKLSAQYARTLARYREAFGHEPPPDVWPRPVERRPVTPLSAEQHRVSLRYLGAGLLTVAAVVAVITLGSVETSGVPVATLVAGSFAVTGLWLMSGMYPAPVPEHRDPRKREEKEKGGDGADAGGDLAWGGGDSCDEGGGDSCGDGGGGDGGGGDGGGCGSGCGGGCGS